MFLRSISADQCNSTIAHSHSVRVLTHVDVPAVPLVGHPSWTASSNDYYVYSACLGFPFAFAFIGDLMNAMRCVSRYRLSCLVLVSRYPAR